MRLVLVWKPREGQEENAVEEWLKRIKLRVNDAMVIVVATHCEERQPEIDEPYLRRRFGEIVAACVAVDSRTGHGIEDLRDLILKEASALPQMGELLSSRWVSARQEILSLHKRKSRARILSEFAGSITCTTLKWTHSLCSCTTSVISFTTPTMKVCRM
jgi:hypothetical protein